MCLKNLIQLLNELNNAISFSSYFHTDDSSWCGSLHRGPNPRPEDYPLNCCTWGAYVRFHGKGGKYVGAYGPRQMATWAQRMHQWALTGRQVYAAFNNTDDGIPPSAVADARALAVAMGDLCGVVSPVP